MLFSITLSYLLLLVEILIELINKIFINVLLLVVCVSSTSIISMFLLARTCYQRVFYITHHMQICGGIYTFSLTMHVPFKVQLIHLRPIATGDLISTVKLIGTSALVTNSNLHKTHINRRNLSIKACQLTCVTDGWYTLRCDIKT